MGDLIRDRHGEHTRKHPSGLTVFGAHEGPVVHRNGFGRLFFLLRFLSLGARLGRRALRQLQPVRRRRRRRRERWRADRRPEALFLRGTLRFLPASRRRLGRQDRECRLGLRIPWCDSVSQYIDGSALAQLRKAREVLTGSECMFRASNTVARPWTGILAASAAMRCKACICSVEINCRLSTQPVTPSLVRTLTKRRRVCNTSRRSPCFPVVITRDLSDRSCRIGSATGPTYAWAIGGGPCDCDLQLAIQTQAARASRRTGGRSIRRL